MVYLNNPDELLLVEACLRSDRKAQKALYEKYKDAMYTLAYRVLGNFDDACDALQEGFIQVFRSLENFEGRSSLGAWIRTIVVRAAYKKLKPEIAFEEIELSENSGLYCWDDNLTSEELERAILNLSPGYRLVFTLVEVEGYKHNEVAEMLGISPGTSKSQLFYAKKKLQEELAYMIEP
ncbi:MAG: RNA polymerase sigma factor [Bacteroidales bacterium]|nr:RNA polymerase sigma factor [Bacteroidales bacterium]MCF8454895.1 RNA polymerase sigma factor [Bacteroidales bacterium]